MNDKNKSALKIEVKKKKLNIRFHNITWIIFVIIIGFFSGIIGAEYVISTFEKELIINGQIPYTTEVTKYNKKEITTTIENVSKSLVTIANDLSAPIEGNVSGVVISKDGYIVTNYLEIEEFKKLYVSTYDGKTIEASVIGIDENLDLALLKVDENNLQPIELEEDEISVGTDILAIGNIYKNSKSIVVTDGIITSLSDKIDTESIIQVNAIVNSGNTGGIICNLEGKLIGISSKKISEDKNKQGLYYSVGVKSISKLINQIGNDLNLLGIDGRTIEEEGEVSFKGVYVQDIKEGSIASKAGIQITDIIVSIDNDKIESMVDIYNELKGKSPGDAIECTIIRNLEKKVIELVIDNN